MSVKLADSSLTQSGWSSTKTCHPIEKATEKTTSKVLMGEFTANPATDKLPGN